MVRLGPENKYKCLSSEIINEMLFLSISSSISVLTDKEMGLKVKGRVTSIWLS